jgi:hypothetical protein
MRHERSRMVRAGRAVSRAIVIGVAVLVGQVSLARLVEGQISPGPLSKAHSTLDGPLNCGKCHAGGAVTMNTRCLSCHKEIATLVQQRRGLHARNARAECSSCHPDHAGRDFALVKWPDGSQERFDHARAGWVLEDKHARLTCQRCHTAERRVSPIAALAPKRSSRGWTGLETTCASCHDDVHAGSLGRQCQSCHNVAGWSPAPTFDHQKTDYPLTGKHVDLSCGTCHVTPANRVTDAKRPAAKFTPVAHGDCVSCHADPHGGRLKGTCSSCHATSSFSTVNDRAFSHDRTRYPLRGRHASVTCTGCHIGYPSRIDQPAFATCASCHADPHAGKATLAGAVVDCASCHTLSGFAQVTFTVAQHAKTAYPLEGKHTVVACGACHVRRGASSPGRTARAGARVATEVVMRPMADRCESCHSDAHGAQLPNRTCITCHTVAGWKPSAFGVREHASLRLTLTGRHAAADCGSCHSEKRRGLAPLPAGAFGKAGIAFALNETTCEACHRDPHGGTYVAFAQSRQAGCAACHDTRAFHPSTVTVATHGQFAFALEGAHLAAPCVACHTTMTSGALGASLTRAPSTPAVVYTISGASCAGCHGAPHGDQFATRADGGSCEGCHDLRGWSPASKFVHAANGGFVLGAAHEKIACARCHVTPAESRGALTVRTWRGVPRACEACHRGDVRRGRGA